MVLLCVAWRVLGDVCSVMCHVLFPGGVSCSWWRAQFWVASRVLRDVSFSG